MARQPIKDAQLLQYAANLATVWSGGQAGPPDINVTAEQVAELQAAVDAAQAALTAQTVARSAAKSASTGKRNAFKALRKVLGGLISIVDGYARSTGDPAVYQRAHIDPPAERNPREEAAMPENVTTKVRTDGSITISFKVRSGGGATYEIQRQDMPLAGESTPWLHLATVGKKRFTDPAVPVGQRAIFYRVRTTLSNGVTSEWSEPSISNFGNQGSQGGPMAAREDAA